MLVMEVRKIEDRKGKKDSLKREREASIKKFSGHSSRTFYQLRAFSIFDINN